MPDIASEQRRGHPMKVSHFTTNVPSSATLETAQSRNFAL